MKVAVIKRRKDQKLVVPPPQKCWCLRTYAKIGCLGRWRLESDVYKLVRNSSVQPDGAWGLLGIRGLGPCAGI
eukprot:5969564-Pleurochrysis_carterae.AAC.1